MHLPGMLYRCLCVIAFCCASAAALWGQSVLGGAASVSGKGSCPKSVIGVEGLSIQGVPVRGVLRSTLMRHPSGAWLGGRRRCQT